MAGLLSLLSTLVLFAGADCNENGIEDSLDVAEGRSRDCDSDGVPDECQAGEPLRFVTFRRFRVGSSDWSRTRALIAEDLDGDGWPDLVTASGSPDEVSILAGGPDRVFGAPRNIPVDFHVGYGLAAGDFDGDGDPDLVVPHRVDLTFESPSEMVVLRNEGDFRFAIVGRYAVGTHGWGAVATGDLDGDGALDLAVPRFGTSSVTAVYGNGDGTFGEIRTVGVEPLDNLRYLTVEDLDGDGANDMVVTGTTDRWLVGVMRNLGNGEFAEPVLYDAGPEPVWPEIGDIDRDGDPDIVVGNADSVGVGLLFNDGAGRFPEMRLLEGAYGPHRIRLGDFNGDGWLDIYGNRGVLYLNEGGQRFSDPTFSVMSNGIHTVADLDGDGYSDVAISTERYGEADIGVLYGRGDGTMTSPRIISTDIVPRWNWGRSPLFMHGGDFDGDGDVDLVVASSGRGDDYLAIYQNPGDGSFGEPAIHVLENFSHTDMICLDLDRDGDLDLVSSGVVTMSTRGMVRVLLNRGDGTFADHTTIFFSSFRTPIPNGWHVPGSPVRVAAADFDEDGDTDLVTANYSTEDLSIFWNDGEAQFGEMLLIEPPDGSRYRKPRALVAADLDGDSDSDVALLYRPEYNGISVLWNVGAGKFVKEDIFGFKGEWRSLTEGISLVAGDITGDGIIDLVAGVSDQWTHLWGDTFSHITVLEGQGDGTFAEFEKVVMPRRPMSASLWDVDRDGDLDLVSTGDWRNSRQNTACVLLNDGRGRLSGFFELPSEGQTTAVVVDDLTGDGKVDLAVLNHGSRSIALYVNEAEDGDAPPGPCERGFLRGDLDADGSTSMWDGVQILWHLFSGDIPPGCKDAADADDDGQVRISDAIYLLNFLFRHGPAPPAPFRTCSTDPTPDDLDCAVYPTCPE